MSLHHKNLQIASRAYRQAFEAGLEVQVDSVHKVYLEQEADNVAGSSSK